MNTFGRIFRVSIFGESHGTAVGAMIDGCPPGMSLAAEDFKTDLGRRKGGGSGTTSRKEADIPLLISGIFQHTTTGAPILISFTNSDVRSSDYAALKDIPRPGHADFTAYKKFSGFNDYRGGGHFSGRLTAALVAAGVVAKKITADLSYSSTIIAIGGKKDKKEIANIIEDAVKRGNSVGGIIECRINGLPAGLGEPFFDSLESLISHAVFSIPAVKGIEFGEGFAIAEMEGSEANDRITDISGSTATNNNGGINGGISNGNEIIFRIAVKATPSISLLQQTMNVKSGERVDLKIKGRHDACIALRMGVIVEAAAAIVMADIKLIQESNKVLK